MEKVFSKITTEFVINLYHRYFEELKEVRRQQRSFLIKNNNIILRRLYRMKIRQHLLLPMLDDLEAEITYMLIRHRDPRVILEMSPNTGWSTTWILRALRDNGSGGQLWSYDLHDKSVNLVPPALSRNRWHFVKGDAKETIQGAPDFDYLFIDSDHTPEFAAWYVEHLFPRVKSGMIVSIHDVYHQSNPSEEGVVVLKWLKDRGISSWNISPAVNGEKSQKILFERENLGKEFNKRVHVGTKNSMLFFQLP